MRVAPLGAWFLREVARYVPGSDVGSGLRVAADLPAGTSVRRAASELGSGWRISAPDTVPFALWSAAGHLDDLPEACGRPSVAGATATPRARSRGRRILDAGCGSGPLAAALRDRGAVVTGVDASAGMLALARRRLGEDAALHVVDLRDRLPFADGAFDDVVASLVLHYLEDWEPTLAELRRVLRPGGRLIASVDHPFVAYTLQDPRPDYFATSSYAFDWTFGGRSVPRGPLLMSAPRCLAGQWHGCFDTFNGVVLMTFVTLPLAVLVAWALARRRRAAGVPAAWRMSLAEVGMVHGTVPWIWMTMMPGAGAGIVPGRFSLVPLRDLLTMGPLGIGGNLLVFASLGFFAPMRWAALASVPRVLALGAACSVLVESAQYGLQLDRVSSVDDVLINSAGAALAALGSRRWWRTAAPDPSDRPSPAPATTPAG